MQASLKVYGLKKLSALTFKVGLSRVPGSKSFVQTTTTELLSASRRWYLLYVELTQVVAVVPKGLMGTGAVFC